MFELSHPKHYYQFKHLLLHLIAVNDKVLILARPKDVLLNILGEENIPYTVFGRYKEGLFSKFIILPVLLRNYFRIIRNFKPDMIISKASPYSVFMKPFFKGKVIIAPDSEVVKLTKKFVAPFADLIITPRTFKLDYGEKHKRIDGFFEETYLSPKVFTPDPQKVSKYNINYTKPYFILRFVSWNANHDVGQFGFSNNQKIMLFNFLSNYGEVYISSEKNNLPEILLRNTLKIDATDIHHVLSFATAYIGDSQTMAAESALLGTPSLRYNSFVGADDMSNFIILENKYGLLKNFRDFNLLIEELRNILDNGNSKNQWKEKRDLYFNNKPDLNDQMYSILTS